MTRFTRLLNISVAALAVCFLPGMARAALKTYRFENVSNNSATDAATGEAQLFVDVFDNASDPLGGTSLAIDPGQVGFRFRNEGPLASSITDLYFEDGALVAMDGTIRGSDDVEFSQGAQPKNLPGGDLTVTRYFFSADSDSPIRPNGVDPGQWVIVAFDLAAGKDYDDVITALATRPVQPGTGKTLRIGVKVQGFDGGGSESFVNLPIPEPVPEPATVLLWGGLSLLGACGVACRRKRA